MEKNSNGIIVFIILCFSIWIWDNYSDIDKLKNQISTLQDKNDRLERRVSNYEDALSDANNNIEEANSTISEAKLYAWESYEEMGEALDNLQEVDTIRNP